MPRPKKQADTKKDNRLTVYLTDTEAEALRAVSERDERPMTQIVTSAVREWLLRLLEPPESLRTARREAIMQEQALMVRGFVCSNGHSFFVDWVEPKEPTTCPICGSTRAIKRTWGGTVKRGV